MTLMGKKNGDLVCLSTKQESFKEQFILAKMLLLLCANIGNAIKALNL